MEEAEERIEEIAGGLGAAFAEAVEESASEVRETLEMESGEPT